MYASEELKNNEAIVLTAVTQNGYTLKLASEELKNNEAIVLRALEYAQRSRRTAWPSPSQLSLRRCGRSATHRRT